MALHGETFNWAGSVETSLQMCIVCDKNQLNHLLTDRKPLKDWNSEDLDEMPQNVASHLGLHCSDKNQGQLISDRNPM